MVECPVCGKWLKHYFALNGHMRLKGDELHQTYFEAHDKQIPKKNITDIENQLDEFRSSFEWLSDYLVKLHEEVWSMLNKIEDTTLRLTKVEQLVQSNMHSSKSIIQQEEKIEIPQKNGKKPSTWAELIKLYGNEKEVFEKVSYFDLSLIIRYDYTISRPEREEILNKAYEKWRNE